MKKILAVLLVSVMVFSFIGCSNKEGKAEKKTEESNISDDINLDDLEISDVGKEGQKVVDVMKEELPNVKFDCYEAKPYKDKPDEKVLYITTYDVEPTANEEEANEFFYAIAHSILYNTVSYLDYSSIVYNYGLGVYVSVDFGDDEFSSSLTCILEDDSINQVYENAYASNPLFKKIDSQKNYEKELSDILDKYSDN